MSSTNDTSIVIASSPRDVAVDPPPVKLRAVSQWYNPGSAGCTGFWRHTALVVPSALFVLYLGFQAHRNIRKLRHRKSFVMIAYYALLWLAAILNLSWALAQGWECDPEKATAWNLFSLFTVCSILFLEFSILAFLLQENYASGLEALAPTFLVSGCFVAVDAVIQVVSNLAAHPVAISLKKAILEKPNLYNDRMDNRKEAIFIFGFGVPVFTNVDGPQWGKWSILFLHTLALTAVYCYILFVHYSKWKDKLPPRPSFYNYVVVMFIVNAMALFACGLAGINFGFGIWLYDLIDICRHSLYLPFLYLTFLADFFQEEDWLLDNAYYSEMKDAGFFDTEWD